MKNKRAEFWIRFAVMVATGVLIPFLYLVIRWNIFEYRPKITFGIMGVVCILFIFLAIVVLIKLYVSGMKTKYSYFKQLLDGLVRLIFPLAAALGMLYVFKDYISQMIEFLLVAIPCELVAIAVNPLPKWAFENNVEGLAEISDKIFKRNKGGQEE